MGFWSSVASANVMNSASDIFTEDKEKQDCSAKDKLFEKNFSKAKKDIEEFSLAPDQDFLNRTIHEDEE